MCAPNRTYFAVIKLRAPIGCHKLRKNTPCLFYSTTCVRETYRCKVCNEENVVTFERKFRDEHDPYVIIMESTIGNNTRI